MTRCDNAPFELRGVTVRAAGGQSPVLDRIDLAIRPGEWITIAGANGSGKSTLAGVVAGLIEPDEGTLHRGFAGEAPIPYVMQQDGPFFGDTPLDEVYFVLDARGEPSENIPRLAESILRETHLFPLRNRPLDTLSGGQRQLVAVAACLAAGAPLLLFDEATAMLDDRSRRLVLDTAARLYRRGSTVLWCTHRLEETMEDGRVIVLEDGRKTADERTADFFYKEAPDGRTPCDRAGFIPPLAVRTARLLIGTGWKPDKLPLDGPGLVRALAEADARA